MKIEFGFFTVMSASGDTVQQPPAVGAPAKTPIDVLAVPNSSGICCTGPLGPEAGLCAASGASSAVQQNLASLIFLDVLADVEDVLTCSAFLVKDALALLGLEQADVKTGPGAEEYFKAVHAAMKKVAFAPEVYMTFVRGGVGVSAPRLFIQPTVFDIVRATWPHPLDLNNPVVVAVEKERVNLKLMLV